MEKTTDVTLYDIEGYTQQYTKIGELGRGKFGTVFHVKNNEDGRSFASKHIRARTRDQREKVKYEINILKEISNPQIVRFHAAFESWNELVIITELLSGGELFDRIVAEEFEITELDCTLYLRQICRGVEYLHKEGFIFDAESIVGAEGPFLVTNRGF